MIQRTVLSSWKSVELEAAENMRLTGLLELEDCCGQNVFLWTPDAAGDSSIFDPNLSRFKVAISIQTIEKITADNTHSDYGAIDIKLKDGTNFPTFYFKQFGNLAVSQLLAFLVEQKLGEYEFSCTSLVHITLQSSRQTFIPKGFISPSRFLVILGHWKALDALGVHHLERRRKETLSVEEFEAHLNDDGSIKDIESLKRKILETEMASEIRPRIWPVLFGVYPASASEARKREIDAENLTVFEKLRQQFLLMVEIKHPAIWNISLSVETDTVWLRSKPKLCEFIKDILFVYSQYNRECGHIGGLADILASIVQVLVGDKIDETIVMRDGRTMTRDEALGFVFYNFVGFLERNRRDQIFTYPMKSQKFSSDRIFLIIKVADAPLSSWLELHGLMDLSFLYRKVVLSFQRDLEPEALFRLWDAIGAAPKENQILRFFSASFVISLFLPVLEREVGTPSDFLDVMDEVSKLLNVGKLIAMSLNLIQLLRSKPSLEWLFMDIPGNEELHDFNPTMLTIQ